MLLGRQAFAFGVEYFQIRCGTAVVAQFGEPGTFVLQIQRGAQGLHLFVQPVPGCQRIRNVAESGLDALLVSHYRLFAPDLGQVKRGLTTPPVENRQRNARRE